jgi:citrate synthase
MTETQKTAKLSLNGQDYELPIFSPTIGPDVLDIRKL